LGCKDVLLTLGVIILKGALVNGAACEQLEKQRCRMRAGAWRLVRRGDGSGDGKEDEKQRSLFSKGEEKSENRIRNAGRRGPRRIIYGSGDATCAANFGGAGS
jgi:hypothetical protein